MLHVQEHVTLSSSLYVHCSRTEGGKEGDSPHIKRRIKAAGIQAGIKPQTFCYEAAVLTSAPLSWPREVPVTKG